jgi:hypothetical protein
MTESQIEARIQAVKTAKLAKMTTDGRENLMPAEAESVIAQVEAEHARQSEKKKDEALPMPIPTRKRGRPRFSPRATPLPTPPKPAPCDANIAWIAAHNHLARASRVLAEIEQDLKSLDPPTRRFVAAQLHTITSTLKD